MAKRVSIEGGRFTIVIETTGTVRFEEYDVCERIVEHPYRRLLAAVAYELDRLRTALVYDNKASGRPTCVVCHYPIEQHYDACPIRSSFVEE